MKRILILLIFLELTACLFSQDITAMKRFANQLMQKKEYYRAITEYNRINSYFPNNSDYIDNLNNIAKCYSEGGHYLESISAYKDILKIEPNNKDAIFNVVTNYSQISYFYESNDQIDKYLNKVTKQDRDNLLINSSLNYINLKKYDKAINQLDAVQSFKFQNKANEFKNIILNNTPLSYKKKSVAIAYSLLIPGGGYFYTKRYQTGFSSLIVNSILFYATYDCFSHDKKGLGIVSGIFFTSFYMGSIYGSIQMVDNYNKTIQINFIKKFKF